MGPRSASTARSIVLWTAVLVASLAVTVLAPRGAPAGPTAAGFGSGPVNPGTPQTSAWARAVTGLAPGVDRSSANVCRRGEAACLDAVVGEMETRLAALGCDHAAVFAFTYLEMTRGVAARAADSDYFADPRRVTLLDAVFARLYFDAIDNWTSGRTGDVPGAWQMAFAAADEERVSAAADLLLGMNAHITRDLAYAVASILEADVPTSDTNVASTGGDDFLRVNDVIAEVRGPMIEGVAQRFDPSLRLLGGDAPVPAGTEDLDAVSLIARWRTQAFDLGVRLAGAGSASERADIEAEIERVAVTAAVAIIDVDASLPRRSPAPDRGAYCQRNVADSTSSG